MSKQHIFSRDEGPFWPFLVVYAAAAAWYLLLPGQLHLGTAVLIMIALALWPLIRSTAYAAFPILKPTPGVLR